MLVVREVVAGFSRLVHVTRTVAELGEEELLVRPLVAEGLIFQSSLRRQHVVVARALPVTVDAQPICRVNRISA